MTHDGKGLWVSTLAVAAVIAPLLAMMTKWGAPYLVVGFKQMIVATALIVGALVIAAIMIAYQLFARKPRVKPVLQWAAVLAIIASAAVGELILCIALAGCC